jgi:hypothetical protein
MIRSMRESRFLGGVAAALVVLGFGLATSLAADDEPLTMRDLVRRDNRDKNAAPLTTAVGMNVKHLLAMEHTILIVRNDREEAVLDPEKRKFTLGDHIRIRIRPLTDSYLYIFYEGAGGERRCLLPEKEEKPPFVKAGQSVDLPSDGTFEFIAPPGKELLRVVATQEPTSDLAGLLNVVFDKPKLTPQEEELKKALRAKVEARLQSISAQQAKAMTYRGLLTEEGMKQIRGQVEESHSEEVVLRELPGGKSESTFTMVAAAKAKGPPLLVTIPLQSVRLDQR